MSDAHNSQSFNGYTVKSFCVFIKNVLGFSSDL